MPGDYVLCVPRAASVHLYEREKSSRVTRNDETQFINYLGILVNCHKCMYTVSIFFSKISRGGHMVRLKNSGRRQILGVLLITTCVSVCVHGYERVCGCVGGCICGTSTEIGYLYLHIRICIGRKVKSVRARFEL